jgi:hypothetical protein
MFSTTDNISDPQSWSKPQPLFPTQPDNIRLWTDFWVICDLARAYVFFSSRDGNLWRSQTDLKDFPAGWSTPQSCLEGDFLAGARIYKLRRYPNYFAVVEAQDTGRRYLKAYFSAHLGGRWDDLATSANKPFASPRNIRQDPSWILSISHGEILRTGPNQYQEIDPLNLRYLFAAIDLYDQVDRPYGHLPWRIGLLEPQ